MTVQSDLKRALAAATEDQLAKTMFLQMGQDMDSHIQQLNSRLSYLNSVNPMNKDKV